MTNITTLASHYGLDRLLPTALGFDEPCFGVFPDGSKLVKINGEPRNWNDNVINGETTSAPTFSQAFRWFRDKRGLVSLISFRIDLPKKY